MLMAALKGKAYDYVFNLGGYIDHSLYFQGGRKVIEAHLIGVMNLLDCLERGLVKGFVQVGSSDEYGICPAPQKEDMRECAISCYSFAKTSASHLVQMLYRTEGFPASVARFFLVYGPGQDDKRFLPQIIKACLKGEEFKTSLGLQLRDFCYVDDAVEGLVQAALSPRAPGQIFNIASGVPVTIRAMVEKIIQIIGKGTPLWGTYPYRKGENMALYADVARSKELLAWSTQAPLEEGLEKTIKYYRQVFLK